MTEADTGEGPLGVFKVSLAVLTSTAESWSLSGLGVRGRASDTRDCQSAKRWRSWRILENWSRPGGGTSVCKATSMIMISIEWPCGKTGVTESVQSGRMAGETSTRSMQRGSLFEKQCVGSTFPWAVLRRTMPVLSRSRRRAACSGAWWEPERDRYLDRRSARPH